MMCKHNNTIKSAPYGAGGKVWVDIICKDCWAVIGQEEVK